MLAASNALPRVVLLILLVSSPSFAAMRIAAMVRQQQLPGKAPQKTGAVEGRVRDANGRPVGGATATLRNLATGEIRKETTNAEGVFRLVDVPAGEYELGIAGAGYETLVEANVTVAAGGLLTREIKLVAAAGATPPAPSGGEQLPPSTPSAAATESTAPGYSGAKQSPDLQPGAPPNTASATFPPDGEVFQAEPNRWRVTMPEWNRYGTGGEHPYVHGSKWDPFDKNKWKGDVPVIGQQIFFNFTGISDTFFDGRRLPVPSGVSTAQPGTPGFFGKGEQIFLDQLFIFSFDLFHGDAAFRPVDWRIRITPAVSTNYLAVRELGIVAVNVRDGTTRLDGHLGFQ
jgi:hypothetical protein